MNYYRRYMGDYSRDTSHLTLAEHGAYNVLLDHYYASRAPLPESLDGLYRICRAMSKPEQQAVQAVAAQFFPVGKDGLRHNPRADAELDIWDARAKTSRGNGGKGGRPKKEPGNNPVGSDLDNPEGTEAGTQREPAHNPIPETRNQKPEARDQKLPADSRTSVGLTPDRGLVEAVFEHWQTVHRHPQARLDEKRRTLIAKALKSYSAEQLREAISGYLNSPHHMGQNDKSTVYDDIELFLRDAKHIDAGLRFFAQPPRTDQSTLTRKNVAATSDWVPPEMRRAAS